MDFTSTASGGNRQLSGALIITLAEHTAMMQYL
jgi:hypothetical protein